MRSELFLKLFSLAVAVVVFLYSQGATTGSIERAVPDVPVTALGLPAGLVVRSIAPPAITVTVTGSPSAVNSLDVSRIGAAVYLTGARPGARPYFVQVTVPPGLRVVASTPLDVTVTVEQVDVQQQQVRVQTEGQPAQGYGIAGTPSATPSVVEVSGPATAVLKVASVVATVPVSSATGTVDATADPVAVDASGQPVSGVQVSPAQVAVHVPIAPVVPQKQVRVQVQVSGQPAAGYAFSGGAASPPEVTVLGPQQALARVAAVAAEPVSIAGATGTVRQTVGLILPPGVTAVSPNAVTVTASVTRSPS
jgi:YbbR domain-containing protein